MRKAKRGVSNTKKGEKLEITSGKCGRASRKVERDVEDALWRRVDLPGG